MIFDKVKSIFGGSGSEDSNHDRGYEIEELENDPLMNKIWLNYIFKINIQTLTIDQDQLTKVSNDIGSKIKDELGISEDRKGRNRVSKDLIELGFPETLLVQGEELEYAPGIDSELTFSIIFKPRLENGDHSKPSKPTKALLESFEAYKPINILKSMEKINKIKKILIEELEIKGNKSYYYIDILDPTKMEKSNRDAYTILNEDKIVLMGEVSPVKRISYPLKERLELNSKYPEIEKKIFRNPINKAKPEFFKDLIGNADPENQKMVNDLLKEYEII